MPGYRPDIDGLRALAVLSVIAFHAFPSWLPGGFIGVDIFFVISGFLITQLIQDGLQRQGFRVAAFYAARVRRLFPSLAIVLLACLAFGWFALLSDEYAELGKHTAASAVFIPNLVFWSESGYFDGAAEAKPLWHLWSLGIEEQFYLLWPVVLVLGIRLGIGAMQTGAALLLLSLALNLIMVGEAASAAFFLPVSRMWELLSGCLLACALRSGSPVAVALGRRLETHRLLHEAAAMAGLALLLSGVFVLDRDLNFPGAWAGVPVLGTAVLLVTGKGAWVNRALLSCRPLVWIGLISFPLYLWHWPLLSFAGLLGGGKPDWPLRAALVAASFGMAGLTYLLVERPLRFGRHLAAKTRALVVVMVVAGGLGLATFLQDGFASRIANREVAAQLADLTFDLPDSDGWYCTGSGQDGPRCHSTGPAPTVVVIGDSHALMIYPALGERFKAKGETVGMYGASDGCPPLLDVVSQDDGGDVRNCLKKGSRTIRRIIDDPAIREVILTSRGPMYTTGRGFGDVESDQFGAWVLHVDGEEKGARSNADVFAEGLSKTLDALLAAGKKVTFLHDVPELGFDIRRCFAFRPLSLNRDVPEPCAVSRREVEARNELHRKMVDRILMQRPAVRVIDLADALCDPTWCFAARDGALFYIDDDHLSHRGAAYVVRQLWDKF